jgi:hypothetical protein
MRTVVGAIPFRTMTINENGIDRISWFSDMQNSAPTLITKGKSPFDQRFFLKNPFEEKLN